MSDYLPNEVMMDILARLPVRTILQIRCVCKSWCSLITSDNFVTFCLNRTIHMNNINNTHLLLIKCYTKPQSKEIFSLYLDDDALTGYHLNLGNPPIPKLTILGSCNGLVCLIHDMGSYSDRLCLCNFTIRKFVVIPEPHITFESHGRYERALGYGFESTTNDYKVVRIVYISGGPVLEIYSLKERCWRQITASGPIPDIRCDSPHAFLNGAIHWVSRAGSLIVSFNLGTEVFSEMELPQSVSLNSYVSVFQDSLCLLKNNFDKGKVSIWVMKEYGVVESWTKQGSFYFSRGGSAEVIGLKRNGEIFYTKDEEMISVCLKVEKFKCLGIRGYDAPFCVNTYTESLVLIDKVNGGYGEQAWSSLLNGKESITFCGRVGSHQKKKPRIGTKLNYQARMMIRIAAVPILLRRRLRSSRKGRRRGRREEEKEKKKKKSPFVSSNQVAKKSVSNWF